ncbi:uncharacterized protein JN550_008363 [Neoarthrinium moseri]|uniref:uncharacterized protein n=1 Tax=Neoarthrinium moseri TaxID=1658444 RepID=UPI001FDB952A|nr:uncharacterized protein JN550_008363 [Neoarthrinium moseri]KAI1865315.1 hypothetical protein JN550_008363 [Neoarthrinium moseri]
MDYHFHTFFTLACEQPPERIAPVLHVLLDYDADVADGWGGNAGALYAAIIGGQPRGVIENVLACHSSQHVPLNQGHVGAAIHRGDQEILTLLFSSGKVRFEVAVAEDYVEQAEKTGDKAIIALVRDWAEKKSKADGDTQRLWSRRWRKLLRFR